MAEIVRAFDTRADVREGEWVRGPDGRLDMDVSIRGTIDGKTMLAVVECKDFDRSSTGPVGRHYVDALDSKRRDLGADIAVICSNAGFTRDALRKAKRTNIGMVSVLKSRDPRIRAVIEEEMYLYRVRFGPWNFTYHGDETIRSLEPRAHQVTFQGRSLDSWLQHRASLIASANPDVAEPIVATFRFREPMSCESPIGVVIITAVAVTFSYTTQWYSKVVQLDASLGLYNYIRGRVQLAPGTNTYTISGIDFDNADPISPPERAHIMSGRPVSGEIGVSVSMVEGLNTVGYEEVPALEPYVVAEDLSIQLPGYPEPTGLLPYR